MRRAADPGIGAVGRTRAARHRGRPTRAGMRVGAGVLGLLLLVVVPGRGGAADVDVHDLHETYADLAIEGHVVAGRLQLFRGQLEAALGPAAGADAVTLSPGAEADSLVMRYVRDRLALVVRDGALQPELLATEVVRLGHHEGWQMTLSWEATAPIDTLRVRNTLLFELHDDQRNVMRFVRFPGETRVTVTLEPGAPEAVVAP